MLNNQAISLIDGEARQMGENVFVLLQDSEGGTQSVVVTEQDLERLLAVCRER